MTNDLSKNIDSKPETGKKIVNGNEEFLVEKLPPINKAFPKYIGLWMNPSPYDDEGRRKIKFDYYALWDFHQRILRQINPDLDTTIFDKFYSFEENIYRREFSMSPLVIIKQKGEIAGGAWLERPKNKAQEMHVFVKPEYEGKGLGKELVKNIEELIEDETETIECVLPKEYNRTIEFFKRMKNYKLVDNVLATKKVIR